MISDAASTARSFAEPLESPVSAKKRFNLGAILLRGRACTLHDNFAGLWCIRSAINIAIIADIPISNHARPAGSAVFVTELHRENKPGSNAESEHHLQMLMEALSRPIHIPTTYTAAIVKIRSTPIPIHPYNHPINGASTSEGALAITATNIRSTCRMGASVIEL
jgi:hypothetical protein